jgi:RNA recognition motif-containing protein
MGLDLHKRKIFIQKLSPQTTERSLKDYFSKYPIDSCKVPVDESGKIATAFLIHMK